MQFIFNYFDGMSYNPTAATSPGVNLEHQDRLHVHAPYQLMNKAVPAPAKETAKYASVSCLPNNWWQCSLFWTILDGMSCNPTAATSPGVNLEQILINDLDLQSIKTG